MAIYITRGNYSDHAFKGMLHHPEDRHDAVAKMFEAAGGKLVDYYITMGEYDFMVVSEFPNGVDALTALVVAAGTGGVRTLNTVAAYTTADAKKAESKARKIAAGFKPAGG
ncbi:MAG TPA: GYD domain-containing protein [Bauldia sp.]|nr:GYD domain-containing protein [Bauldia sp.]